MDITQVLEALFRWIHVVAGILWIGLLYFFNFVNGPFEGTLDGPGKKTVVPQLRPRALYWFRWGAAWTWVMGVLLLLLVFYHGRQMFPSPDMGWTGGSFLMLAVTFLAFAVYDPIANAIKDNKQMAAVGFVLLAIAILGYLYVGHFGYRATVIHTGALMGTLMAANVWMRIWPKQRKIITAIRDGQAPDPADVATAGARSRHNTYMSVPLVWAMLEQHTTGFAGAPLATWFWLLVVIAVAWGVVVQLYKKTAAVKGF